MHVACVSRDTSVPKGRAPVPAYAPGALGIIADVLPANKFAGSCVSGFSTEEKVAP